MRVLFSKGNLLVISIFCSVFFITAGIHAEPQTENRADALMKKNRQRLAQECADKGVVLGHPVFIRIFKLKGELEVWIEKENRYQLFKTYPICSYSGFLGPKIREGDWQSPEGFYTVSMEQLNPKSQYHLSFNIGYPNSYDQEKGRTGSSIMVHGGCASKGCFAMGDFRMEEIYLLAYSALAGGQEKFSVHIFPFRMTPENMAKYAFSPWITFWEQLKPGYSAFADTRQVPSITMANGTYEINRKIQMVEAENAGNRDL